jgi:hypothetical protein
MRGNLLIFISEAAVHIIAQHPEGTKVASGMKDLLQMRDEDASWLGHGNRALKEEREPATYKVAEGKQGVSWVDKRQIRDRQGVLWGFSWS